MPAPLLIPLGIKAICWCGTLLGIGYVCKKGHDAYKQSQKTKQQRLALKGKSIEQAREENKRLNTRNQELEDKLKQGEDKEKEIEKQISDIKKELDDPNTTKQREEELKVQLGFLQTQLDDLRKNNKSYRDEIKRNNKQMEDNNNFANKTASNPDDKHWIWEFLTLENIMIIGACYVLWQMMKEEKRERRY